MLVRFAKWGNSLAVRIPAGLAQDIAAREGRTARIRVDEGRLVIEPVDEAPVYTLDELLEGMTSEDAYPETPTGRAVGDEVA